MTSMIMIPLSFPVSILVAYSLFGARLFGLALVGFWSAVVVGFVIVMEKTGYARNFESWEFRLTRNKLLALPLSFLIIVGGLYLMILFLRKT